jgi:hypothetical protein
LVVGLTIYLSEFLTVFLVASKKKKPSSREIWATRQLTLPDQLGAF